jgi:hypothetical protein
VPSAAVGKAFADGFYVFADGCERSTKDLFAVVQVLQGTNCHKSRLQLRHDRYICQHADASISFLFHLFEMRSPDLVQSRTKHILKTTFQRALLLTQEYIYIYCFAIVHLGAFCIENAPTLIATKSCPVATGAHSVSHPEISNFRM